MRSVSSGARAAPPRLAVLDLALRENVSISRTSSPMLVNAPTNGASALRRSCASRWFAMFV